MHRPVLPSPRPPRVTVPAPTMVPQQKRWKALVVKQQSNERSFRLQVAGIWIAAAGLVLALLRTVLDIMEVIGR